MSNPTDPKTEDQEAKNAREAQEKRQRDLKDAERLGVAAPVQPTERK